MEWKYDGDFNEMAGMLIYGITMKYLVDEGREDEVNISVKTGIAESTISDWWKKKTNPTADKIMIICKVLDVDPEWLLSDIEPQGDRGNPREWYAIKADTDGGRLITAFNSMDKARQARLLGYAEALKM